MAGVSGSAPKSSRKTRAYAALKYAVAQGHVHKPDTCGDCGRHVPSSHNVWAHIPDYFAPLVNIEWLCQKCWYKRFPRKSPLKHPRKEVIRKLPAYEVLRHDYLVLGLSFRQIGKKYGVNNYVNVFRVMKYRASRRGEWPLAAKRYQIKPVAIVDMVYDHVEKKQLTIRSFAASIGMNDQKFYDWRMRKVKNMRPEEARVILEAIGEDVPEWIIEITDARREQVLATAS